VKVAAAVLGASLLFFLGVLTGIGRRESVPPPSAIPLGVIGTPAASGTFTSTSPSGAPEGGSKGTTTTTTAEAPPAKSAPTGVTPTTSTTPAKGPATVPSTTGTGPGPVQQVDNQVDCRSSGNRGKGHRQPCPSTTSSTTEAPGGGRNR